MKKKNLEKEITWLKRDCLKCGQAEIERLKKGEPLDYIIGWKEFLGCRIDLSYKPLIPREETEFWVEQVIKDLAIKPLDSKSQKLTVLDLFAGSGCIGLAVLKHYPKIQMTFGEKEDKLVKQIKKNLKINKLKARVVQTDIFSRITGQFDVILANPPYAQTRWIKRVQKSVLLHEPRLAVFGGTDGLKFIKPFLRQAKNHLHPGGEIFLEFDTGQRPAIMGLLKQFGYTDWQFHKDQFGRSRWVKVSLPLRVGVLQ